MIVLIMPLYMFILMLTLIHDIDHVAGKELAWHELTTEQQTERKKAFIVRELPLIDEKLDRQIALDTVERDRRAAVAELVNNREPAL